MCIALGSSEVGTSFLLYLKRLSEKLKGQFWVWPRSSWSCSLQRRTWAWCLATRQSASQSRTKGHTDLDSLSLNEQGLTRGVWEEEGDVYGQVQRKSQNLVWPRLPGVLLYHRIRQGTFQHFPPRLPGRSTFYA